MITSYSQAKSIVTNKFLNSSYIQSRNINSDKKYFSEEVDYWARKIINTNMSESLFNTEFDLVYSSSQTSSYLSSLRYNDFIGQTFYIDSNSNPNGLFLSSIGVFFSTVDDSIPISLEIRPLVNGYPSSTEIIPLSKVTLYPTNTLPATLPLTSNQATKFIFDFPVYLEPGYYCFVLNTNSSKYNLYMAERGLADLYSGKVVVNPYIGSFTVSQQGFSWSVEQTKDLCFVLNRAVFDVGTKTVQISTQKDNFDYTTINAQSKTQEFGKLSYINSVSTTSTNKNTLLQTDSQIKLNKNVDLNTVSTANVSGGSLVNVTLTNTTDKLSPLIDLNKSGIVLTKNLIDPYSVQLSNSELTNNGSSQCKYITKQITLNDNFDADGLTVYIDTNKPTGSTIEVFYKIQNKYDYTQEFKDCSWVKMSKISESASPVNSGDYIEETYQNVNLTYLDAKGTYHTNFKYFAIKIVMYANNPCLVPTVKNLRAIATV